MSTLYIQNFLGGPFSLQVHGGWAPTIPETNHEPQGHHHHPVMCGPQHSHIPLWPKPPPTLISLHISSPNITIFGGDRFCVVESQEQVHIWDGSCMLRNRVLLATILSLFLVPSTWIYWPTSISRPQRVQRERSTKPWGCRRLTWGLECSWWLKMAPWLPSPLAAIMPQQYQLLVLFLQLQASILDCLEGVVTTSDYIFFMKNI